MPDPSCAHCFVCLVGCSIAKPKQEPEHWVLESYDEQKGFEFRKGKFVYRMVCYSASYGQSEVYYESERKVANEECSGILPAMGKSVELGPDNSHMTRFENIVSRRSPLNTETHPPSFDHMEFKIVEVRWASK